MSADNVIGRIAMQRIDNEDGSLAGWEWFARAVSGKPIIGGHASSLDALLFSIREYLTSEGYL